MADKKSKDSVNTLETSSTGNEDVNNTAAQVTVKTVVVPNAPKPDINYWVNISPVDQGLLGPDDCSRVVPPFSYVHGTQAKIPGLLTRAKGCFIKVKVEKLRELSNMDKSLLIIGGPLNNAKGTYLPG